MNGKVFYGWWVTAAAFVTFGMAVGVPYYGMPFFYDYYQKAFGWSRSEITLGFPLAALLTLPIGPLLVHRFSPRMLIVIGTALTCLAMNGFGMMSGDLWIYRGLWFSYTVGYIFSGPIPHQVIISQWFRKNRGTAMGIAYLGVGLFGGLSQQFIALPLIRAFGWQMAFRITGFSLLLTWPIVFFVLRDRPAEMGLNPDGAKTADHASFSLKPQSFGFLLHQKAFWLLTMGSFCSIGSIGAINQHMKLLLATDKGYSGELVAQTNTVILWSSIAGRVVMGWLADRFPKKYVMLATYLFVALPIPMLYFMNPPTSPYLFGLIFGFAMGADYMLIPLMAAEQFGTNTLARAMAIILPTDTIGQTWFPYGVARLREHFGDYGVALGVVFALAMLGAIAVGLLPRRGRQDEELHLQDAERVTARG